MFIHLTRAALPRYRYDQLLYLQWRLFLPTALALFLITITLINFFLYGWQAISKFFYICVHAITILVSLWIFHENVFAYNKYLFVSRAFSILKSKTYLERFMLKKIFEFLFRNTKFNVLFALTCFCAAIRFLQKQNLI